MFITGSIYNTLKTTQLKVKWQQNQNKKQLHEKEEEDPKARQIRQIKEDAARVRQSNVVSNISNKLKAGATLSSQELEYLKKNHPDLYQEAMEIKQERQAYKKALKACKTKEDVEKLKVQKMQNFLMEARTISNNPNIPKGEKVKLLEKILKKVMGVQSEHIEFVKSQEYRDLPREEEVEKEREDAKEEWEPEVKEETEDESFGSVLNELSQLLEKDQGEYPLPEQNSTSPIQTETYKTYTQNRSVDIPYDSPESKTKYKV